MNPTFPWHGAWFEKVTHSQHLAFVLFCIAEDVPVPYCSECHAIVETFTVAGSPIKVETVDD